MTWKKWTPETIPKDRPIYIRRKHLHFGGALVFGISPEGVNVLVAHPNGDINSIGITWSELFLTCQQIDGSVCGIKK